MTTLARRAVFFALQRLIGSHAGTCYRELLDAESWSPERLATVQQERIRNLLKHSLQNIPFYKERAIGTDLAGFPIVAKRDLRNGFESFMTPSLAAAWKSGVKQRPYDWVEVRTGGSTGVPTTVIHDRDMRDRGRAARLYAQHLSGFSFGTPYVRLWGSMRDINHSRDSLQQRVMARLSNETLINAFRMNADDMDRYLSVLQTSGAKHLMAYVDAAEQLARHATETGASLPRLRSIMACAGTLTDGTRRLLAESFGARIHNMYGSRDCGCMACECERGGFHMLSNQVVIEVVDDHGRPVRPGESGRILVTLLFNREFPLIRYEIGDVGALAPAACPCGRAFPMLASLQGRILEFLTTSSGGYVSPVYIRHLIGVVHNPGHIRRFQLIQNNATDFDLVIEPDAGVDTTALDETVRNILRDLREVFGAPSRVTTRVVERIAESDSGKFLYTLNRMRHEHPVRP